MLIESSVSHVKFEREVARLRSQEETLRLRGCILLNAVFPSVDMLFLPDKALRFAVATPAMASLIINPNTGQAQAQLQWTQGELKAVGAHPFAVRFSLEDYDVLPPSVLFLEPRTMRPLAYDELTLGHLTGPDGKPQLVVLDQHPVTKKPFLCVRGVREYHEHPQHTGDDWFQYRGTIGLFHLIDVIHRTCVGETRPLFVHQPGQVLLSWNHEKAS